MVFRSGPDALLRTPSPALTQRAFYAHWIFDSSVLGTMSNVRKPHYSIGRGCVSFIAGSWEGQFVSPREDQFSNGFNVLFLGFLSPLHFRYCRSVKEGFITSGFTWKSSVSADISVRDKSTGDDGFIVPVRAVHVDEFSLSFGWNRVCLSLSRNHSAAAAHQVGTERQHWTSRYRVPVPTQVSAQCWHLKFPLQVLLWCCYSSVKLSH